MIFAYVASAPSLFMQFYGLSPNAFSLFFAGNAVGLIGAAQVNRWLTRRYDTHAILRAASMVNAVAASSCRSSPGRGRAASPPSSPTSSSAWRRSG